MKTVIFEVRSAREAMQDVVRAVESGMTAQSAIYTFTSAQLVQQMLTPERWQIIELLCGRNAMPVRDIAHSLGRDLTAVEDDVKQLLSSGMLDRTKAGNIRFPFQEIKFDPSFPRTPAIYPARDSGGRCRFR
jgi:predicted transcriptional regulator